MATCSNIKNKVLASVTSVHSINPNPGLLEGFQRTITLRPAVAALLGQNIGSERPVKYSTQAVQVGFVMGFVEPRQLGPLHTVSVQLQEHGLVRSTMGFVEPQTCSFEAVA